MADYYSIFLRKDSTDRYAVYFELTSLWDPATCPFPKEEMTRIAKALYKLCLGCPRPKDFIRNLEKIAEEHECNYYNDKK